MGRRISIAVLLMTVALLGAVAAHAEISQKGNLRIKFDGSFSPRSLPRSRPAPVQVSLEGTIESTDGTHPPPLRRLEVGLNRAGRLSTRGLPVCAAAQLQSTTTATALERCRPALVGRGRFEATLESSGAPIPVSGAMLAFNGRGGGRPALVLHLNSTVPVSATLVLPLAISHPDKGSFGTLLTTRIPSLAGGLGSITHIELRIGREYSYRGQRLSFLSASCAAPPGFPGAPFTLAKGTFSFGDGRQLVTKLTRSCHVR